MCHVQHSVQEKGLHVRERDGLKTNTYLKHLSLCVEVAKMCTHVCVCVHASVLRLVAVVVCSQVTPGGWAMGELSHHGNSIILNSQVLILR